VASKSSVTADNYADYPSEMGFSWYSPFFCLKNAQKNFIYHWSFANI
jgi:hypothetical protein